MLRNISQWGGAGCCEYGNEPADSISCGVYLPTSGPLALSGMILFHVVGYLS
jgi:hypothetical protein